MTARELIEFGYMPRELPPPFNSKTLAEKLEDIKRDWAKLSKSKRKKYSGTQWVNYSIPKVGLHRRTISIPNPLHQTELCQTIADNWAEIEKVLAKSTISSSIPVKDDSKQRAVKTQHDFGEFKRERLVSSFDKSHELKTDISKFYTTIYTHSIPWLLHGKADAKKNRTNKNLLGNQLDKGLRAGNAGQTIGIPIGPDTSLIAAEIISCSLDSFLKEELKSCKCFRFIDDFYIYCDSYADAEKALNTIQELLTKYGLHINEYKTKISKAPFAFDSKWYIEISRFEFRKKPKDQLSDMVRFAGLSFMHSKENPEDSVLLYSIIKLKTLPRFDKNWSTYESLILKIGFTEPRTLPVVAEILSSNKDRIDKEKIKAVIENIIKGQAYKGHHGEVSWALWMCIEFDIKLPDRIAEIIFQTTDVISILIGLHLKHKGLIDSKVSTDKVKSELTEDSLSNASWLLTYESIRKGWLTSASDPIDKNEYFKLLRTHEVTFYDEKARVKTYKVQEGRRGDKPTAKTEQVKKGEETYAGGDSGSTAKTEQIKKGEETYAGGDSGY